MNETVIFAGIIFLIGVLLVIYKYNHRRNLHNNVEQLKHVIDLIFQEAEAEKDKTVISQNRLIKGLKQHLEVNEKTALKLVGKARIEGFIEIDSLDVKHFGKIQFKRKSE